MTTDIIVIGGGIIGSAITYNLTKRGKRVVQLEKEYLVNGASGACDQGILLQSKAPNEHLKLALYSMELYKELGRELGRDLEFTQKGYLVLIENEKERETMESILHACGYQEYWVYPKHPSRYTKDVVPKEVKLSKKE